MLISKGAEANLHLKEFFGRKAVFKRRIPKKYRVVTLDKMIRTYRTKHESLMLHRAKEAGVSTPLIFLVDLIKTEIVMEYIEGKQVKHVLERITSEERKDICKRIGRIIANLHLSGIVHGDLTTSNMIITPDKKLVIIDFGLGEKNNELESKGVDLHLMQRSLKSTHSKYADECFKIIIHAYGEIIGEKMKKAVLEKVKEIGRRGRYFLER